MADIVFSIDKSYSDILTPYFRYIDEISKQINFIFIRLITLLIKNQLHGLYDDFLVNLIKYRCTNF